MPKHWSVVLPVLFFFAAGTSPAAVRAASEADKRLLAKVAAQTFAQLAKQESPYEGFPQAYDLAHPGPRWAWPPLVAISSDREVNAFAALRVIKPGEKPTLHDEPNVEWIAVPGFESKAAGAEDADVAEDPAVADKLKSAPAGSIVQPIMLFKQGYLDEIIRGREGPLAGCFGHELAHHLLKHTFSNPTGAPLVAYAAIRQQEADADALGTAVSLRAGFDYDEIVAGARLERESGYRCSFNGLASTHPGWNDRLALIDSRQRDRWRSIDAFENGAHFLMTEQYLYAEMCFGEVIRKEPKCYEAWANKGYAELMQFCDMLEAEDLREYNLGQLVVGGFYARPGSLLRGFDEELWFAAVGDLRQALLLKPDLIVPKANLAVAWLLCPDGIEAGKAEQLFQEVRKALQAGEFDEDIDPLVHAALLVNAGVAENANGDPAAADSLFKEARELLAASGDRRRGALVDNAIRFNHARMMAARGEEAPRKSAIEELEAYLASGSPAATWWTLAFEEYEKLCRDAGVAPKPREVLENAANVQHRPVSGVVLSGGTALALNEPVKTLDDALGEGLRQPLIDRTNLHRRRYAQQGLDLICSDKVLAIRLQGPQSPPLVLRAAGTSGETRELRSGMSLDELDQALGGDAKDWDLRYGASSAIVYRFYGRLGFGVRLSDEGRVMEIIVAQIPYAAVVDN